MDRDMLAQRMASQNVEDPGRWTAFLAEQMRNIPPLANTPSVPLPMGGQLGQLSNSVSQAIAEIMRRTKGPTPNYVIPNPDEPPYDPTQNWNMQHR